MLRAVCAGHPAVDPSASARFYQGRPGHDRGSGVGSPDVANFARMLQQLH